MNPRDWVDYLNQIMGSYSDYKSQARKYIESNIDLLDSDLEKFIDKCSPKLINDVVSMLQDADIELPANINKLIEEKQDNSTLKQYITTSNKKWDLKKTSDYLVWETPIPRWTTEWAYDTE